MQNSLKNNFELILFDLGNTIFYIDFDKTFAYWAQVSGIEATILEERFQWDDQHKAFERGHLTEEAYTQHLANILGFDLTYEDFFIGWNAIYLENLPGIALLLEELSKNYKIGALSNTNLSHEKVWKDKYKPLFVHFDQVLGSHHLGHVKPEKEIYEKALSLLGAEAQKSIFLDDKLENIEGAERVGITGILVETPAQAYKALFDLEVLSKELYDRLLDIIKIKEKV